jgi:hypothetical protein
VLFAAAWCEPVPVRCVSCSCARNDFFISASREIHGQFKYAHKKGGRVVNRGRRTCQRLRRRERGKVAQGTWNIAGLR